MQQQPPAQFPEIAEAYVMKASLFHSRERQEHQRHNDRVEKGKEMYPKSTADLRTPSTPLPKHAYDPEAHLSYLIEKSSIAQVYGKAQATGGVLPIVRDPDTKITHILLGMNHHQRYCHFHGWVDPGETQDQGAAREAFEESKGLLGDLCSLWRAVVCKGTFSAHVARGGMHLINFGDMNAVERDAVEEKFLKLRAWSPCSDEVAAVKWFDTLSFRHACLNREHEKADIFVEVDVRRGIKRKLRGWLADIFSDRGFWEQELMKQCVDGCFVPLVPISHLPEIEDDNTVRSLPFYLPPAQSDLSDPRNNTTTSRNHQNRNQQQQATQTPSAK